MNIEQITGFDWDVGNWPKCGQHGVSREEIESVFSGDVLIEVDSYPVEIEKRYNAVGIAVSGRHVFVAFTVRIREKDRLIRPISARYMHDKEVRRYDQR